MSILTKIIVAFTLWLPLSSYSLGIGEIKVNSRLNQNLNAQILLVLSNGENLSDIKIKLATQSKFDEAGLLRLPFLSNICFSTKVLPDGTLYITLTTNEPVKEPFLHFLLEVNGLKSTLYREYTVLIDPPSVYLN